jgi:hypothetical protein
MKINEIFMHKHVTLLFFKLEHKYLFYLMNLQNVMGSPNKLSSFGKYRQNLKNFV